MSSIDINYGVLLRSELRRIFETPTGEGRVFAPIRRLEEYINDYELHNPDEQELEETGDIPVEREEIPITPLEPIECEVSVVAVDTSVAVLGETDVGVIAAFKCAVVYSNDRRPEVFRYMTHLTERNRHIYVRLRRLLGASLSVKSRPPKCSLDRMPYRLMNLLERITQRYASTQIRDGIVLWDGAMTRTKETSARIYRNTIRLAKNSRNSIVAISKKTRLRLKNGKRLSTFLDLEREPCFAEVHDFLPNSIRKDLMGRVFVVKFAADGFTFRVDVAPSGGIECVDVLKKLMGTINFVYGYPELLARAHVYSYFTRNEVTALQARAMDMYTLRQTDAFDIRVHILGPFG